MHSINIVRVHALEVESCVVQSLNFLRFQELDASATGMKTSCAPPIRLVGVRKLYKGALLTSTQNSKIQCTICSLKQVPSAPHPGVGEVTTAPLLRNRDIFQCFKSDY
jgi:hypothetical protein